MSSLTAERIRQLSLSGWTCDQYGELCGIPDHKGKKHLLVYDPHRDSGSLQFSGNAVILHIGETLAPGKDGERTGSAITIPPGKFLFFLTKEVIHLPLDVDASLFMNPKVSNLGLLFFTLGHIAPGFHGNLTATLLNVTDRPIILDLESAAQGPLYLVCSRLEKAMPPHPKYHRDPQLDLDIAQKNLAFNLSPAFAFTKSTFVTRTELFFWVGVLLVFVTTAITIVASLLAGR